MLLLLHDLRVGKLGNKGHNRWVLTLSRLLKFCFSGILFIEQGGDGDQGMKFVIDLDGTIAGANYQKRMQVINQLARLGISDEQLSQMSWQEFLSLESFLACFGPEQDRRHVSLMNALQHSPELIAEAIPKEGSQAALHQLAGIGEISYATARGVKVLADMPPEKQTKAARINQAIAESTQWWLQAHHYPSPDNVVYGGGKLQRIADLLIADLAERVVFIDDAPTIFLFGVKKLLSAAQIAVLRERCSIVVYGPQAEHVEQYGHFFRLEPLPSWEALDRLLGDILHGRSTKNPATTTKS